MLKLLTNILICGFVLSGCSDPTPEELAQRAEDTCHDSALAYSNTTRLVKRQLKSPASAEFPLISEQGIYSKQEGDPKQCKFSIIGYVDSQNGFGAMVRTKYFASVQYDKKTDNWTLLNAETF